MVHYKLHYFDMAGRAEPIRLLFNYAGQAFEDVRIPREDWPNQKNKFFYGKVPVLDVDGKQLGESMTILRYLGEKFGLAGKDEFEKAKVNEVVDFHKDTMVELAPYLFVKMGFRPGNADELRKTVFVPGVEQKFPLYVKLLEQSGSGFIAKSGVTFVDFAIADSLSTVKKFEPEVLGKYPKLGEYLNRVMGLPQLKQYLSTRK